MSTSKIRLGPIAVAALLASAALASAGEPVVARLDHSKIFTLARTPTTVVVGNPSIADVTLEGNNLYLHARAFGETNVLVLDENGSQIASYDVTVETGGDNGVYVFKAGASYSYVCAPDCQTTLHVGDQKDFYAEIVKQQEKRNSIALGQKSGESTKVDGQPPPQ